MSVDQLNQATDLDRELLESFLYAGDDSETGWIDFLGTFRECRVALPTTER